jgi:hypothetical protein
MNRNSPAGGAGKLRNFAGAALGFRP